MTTNPRALLPILALALAGPAAAQEDAAAANPLAELARLCAGQWRIGEGGPRSAYHRFDWGPGRRSIRATSFAVGEAGDAPFSEALYFWHPTERVFRGLGFGAGGALYDARMTPEGDTWDWRFDYWSGGDVTPMLDHWVWHGEDAYDWTAYVLRGEEREEWHGAPFRREPRGDGALGDPTPEGAPAGKLAPLERLAGGAWELDTTWPDGTRFHIRDEYRWGLAKAALHKRTSRVADDGGLEPAVDSSFYWHPGERVLRFASLTAWGVLYEGTVVEQDGDLVFEYAGHGPEGTTRYVEWLAFEGQRYRAKLWQLDGDDERTELVTTEYARVDAPPAGEEDGD